MQDYMLSCRAMSQESATRTLAELRADVREFLAQQQQEGVFRPACDAWQRGFSREFSRALAERGWVGMTLPVEYGGSGSSPHERLVVAEELLAHGAPVAAHWVAERQIAPAILKLGTEAQRRRFLPPIARGELVFGLGMSEPNSGSDLASVRTRAVRAAGGWRLSGQKIWTTLAHHADFLLVLCRTSEADRPHVGLSQLLVERASDGVDVRQLPTMDGEDHFCEVFFDEVWVPDDRLLGVEGNGWQQATGELAYERGGPERYLSTFPLLEALVAEAPDSTGCHAPVVGELVAELSALRGMALGIADSMAAGRDFAVEAALLKDAGTEFEQRLVEEVRTAAGGWTGIVVELLAEAIIASPAATLRGGTTEILRGIVSRELVGR
jgi:acyl-CoA dehydrogenase